jgi:hypothetical protein
MKQIPINLDIQVFWGLIQPGDFGGTDIEKPQ